MATNNAPIPTEEVKEPTPIWDENNRLVDPELDTHFREQADVVLGKNETDEERANLTVNPNKPFLSQHMPGMTRDPMTSPFPTADPNTRPSPLTPMSEEAVKQDEELDKAARDMTETQVEAARAESAPVVDPADINARLNTTSTTDVPEGGSAASDAPASTAFNQSPPPPRATDSTSSPGNTESNS